MLNNKALLQKIVESDEMSFLLLKLENCAYD